MSSGPIPILMLLPNGDESWVLTGVVRAGDLAGDLLGPALSDPFSAPWDGITEENLCSAQNLHLGIKFKPSKNTPNTV